MNSKRISMLRNSSSLLALGAASALLTSGPAHAFDASSLPQGGNVTGGSATIATSGNTLTVNQSSNRAVIDWRSFDIGANAQANFNQPGASSIAVNRVNASTDPSRIEGGLHANGQVWILNPNGVMFGKSARVDAAGVVATTANIDDKAFMAGDNRLQMRGGDTGQVVNEGHITVGQGGMAAFVAPSVRNSGSIRARVGRVTLAAGDTFTLDLAGDRLVEIGLGAGKAVVDQSGKIINEGGVITISAEAAGQAVDSLINMSGVTDASSVRTAGGKIVLGADAIAVASNASLKADGTSGGQITAVADKTGNYAGAYSAQGSQGDGGQIETSGKTIHIDGKIVVNTAAAKGKPGSWTLDPNDLTVTAGSGGTISAGVNDDAQSTVGADTVVAALASTNVTLQARNSITVASAINASGNGAAHNLTLADQDGGGLTVNLNAAITLKGAGVLSGGGTVINVGANGLIQNGIDVALAGGATVNVAAGIYAPNVNISKSGLSLIGAPGATINVNPGTGQLNAINIGNTDHVTVSGFTIVGEVTGSYVDYAFGNGISRGVAVVQGATNFTITGNTITNVRNGILVDGRNTGSVTNNFIDNTKSAISLQYSNGGEFGRTLTISGNRQGTAGNEWGLIYHLNQHLVDASTVVNNVAGTASSGVQAALLEASNANNGLSVMDRAYTLSNRTQVVVDASASLSNVDGSPRSPLKTIQGGIDAIVAGGTVNLKDGSYVINAANGYNNGYLGIGKSLKLVGQSEAGVIIDARNASTYGIRVLGGTDHVSLSNFTLLGVAATNAYGIKVEDSTNFSIDHVTSHGAYKAQLDLNGVRGGTVNFVTADGTSNGVGAGSTRGAAIAITDSQNILVSNSSVIGGAYGGIGIYQSNKPSGYAYQTSNVTIDGSNSFNANGAAHYNYVYTEDESASNNFGPLTIAGFDFVAGQDSNLADTFRYFQRTRQGAIDYLDSVGAVNAGYVEGWTGSAANNQFAVANATSGNAMAINPALAAAAAGATITVAPGVYAETLNITKNVDITGAGVGQTIIRPTVLLITGLGHKYDSNVKATVLVNGASNVNLTGLTIDGNNLGNNAVVFWNNASGSISNSRIVNPQAFNGAQTGQDLAVDATGGTTSALTISGVQFANWNKNAIDVVTGGGSTSGGGNVTLNVSDSSFAGRGATGLNEQNGIVLWERGGSGSTINATVDHSTFSDIAYTGSDSNATGILLYGAATGSLAVKNSTFDGSVQKYIGADGGSSVEVNATSGNIFNGVAQGGATLDQLFDVENRLVDGTDNAGNSLVRLNAGQVYVTAAKNNVQNGIDAATAGDTVNVQDGTYVTSGYANGYLSTSKSLNLVGQSEAGTIIDAHGASTYGLRVQADNVSLGNFTLLGSTGAGGFGIKVEPLNLLDANSRINNFSINHVTVNGSTKSALDLNGAVHATIDHVTARNATAGNGIAINDSANVTITNTTTQNNAWGGLRIEQHNNVFNQQTTGIVVNGTNTFRDATPVYLEDDSASRDFGMVEADGFAYAAVNKSNPADVYTLFQNTAQGAIDALGTAAGSGTVQGWTGTAGDNHFTVGVSTGGTVMSINAAVNAASTGAVIALSAGEFNQGVTITKGLTLQGADANDRSRLTQGILLSGSLNGLTLRNLAVSGSPGSAIIQGGTVTNFTIDNVKLDGGSVANRHGIASGQYGGDISITNSQFLNIAGWALFDTRSGAGSTLGQDGTVITSGVFSNNLIDNSQGGVNFRQASSTAGVPLVYPDITISGNTVTNVGNSTNSFGGVFKAFNAGTVNFSNNTVSGVGTSGFNPAGEAPYGAVLLTRGTSVLNVTGNTFTGNNMVYAVEPGKSLPGAVTFTDNSFINNAYGIYLPKNLAGAGTITFTGTNNFAGGASTLQDIVWTSASGLDLTNVKFGGKLGSQMSAAELFAEEDRITHGLDNGAYGLALVRAGNVYVTPSSGSIQRGVDTAASGFAVNVADGAYTLASELDITKSLTLQGQSEAGTILTSNSTGHGINVTADNVSIGNFTYHGPTGTGGATYGIAVRPDTDAADDRLLNFSIKNVTIDRGYLTGLDLNGVVGANINNVDVRNIVHGNGIALTDSADVTLTNVATGNNAWGGLALYQTNSFYNQQLTGISADASNSFGDVIPVYAEDQSAIQDIGSLALTGFNYVVKSPSLANDVYTWFQRTQQAAIDFVTNASLSNSNINLPTATVQGYAGNSVAGNNIFTVSTGTNGVAMSVNAALGQSLAGGVIHVADGTYAENVALAAPRTVDFGTVNLNSLTLDPAAAGTVLSGHVAAGNVALNGAVVLGGNLSLGATGTVAIASVDGAHDLTIASGAGTSLGNLGSATRLGAVSVSGNTTLTGSSYKAGSLALGNTTLASDTTLDAGTVVIASADGAHDLSIAATGTSLGNMGDGIRLGAVTSLGNTTLTGSSYKAGSLTLGATTLASDTTLDAGTVTLASADGAHDLSIASSGTSLGNLGSATRLGAVTSLGDTTLTGSSYKAASIDLGATTLTADTTLDTGTVAIAAADGAHDLTIVATEASLGNLGSATRLGDVTSLGNTTLTGSSYRAGSLALGNTTLAADTTLDAGTVAIASADGAHDLSIASTEVSLGNLGNSTRLGAVTSLGDTTLTGGSYKAGSLALGNTTLTAASTTLDTASSASAAGNIAFSGDIFGTKDGGQSLVLAAGPGTGAKSANGDVSLKNAGTTGVRLGDLKISGDDFLALTVDIVGGFTSHLTGNQIFAADTLNAGGAVNTNASGDVSGHIVAAGNVSLSSGGAVSGNISGDALTLNSASVGNASLQGHSLDATVIGNFDAAVATTGNVNTNVTGNVSGQIASGGNVSLNAGGGVSGNISGNALTVNSGSVSGATLQGNSLNATVAGNFDAAVTTTGSVNTNVTGNVSGQIASGGNVSLNAGGGVSGNVKGDALTVNSGSVSGASLQGNSLNATVAGNFDAAVTTTGNVNTKVAGNVSGQIASGGNVSLNAGGGVSGNIKGDALTVNSGSVSGASLQGNSLNATVAGNFDAAVTTTGSVNTKVAGNVSGQIASGGNVSLNAGGLVSGNIKGDALTVNSGSVGGGATLAGNTVVATVTGNFDAAVNTSGSASVSGNNVSGSFTGSTVSLSGQSVNGQVNAGTLNVSAQDGAVTGNFTPGEVTSNVPLNGGVVGTNPNNYLPQQLVVEGFVLPSGTQIAANGQLILPPGTVIGLLSPGGGTPRVTMVQSVQQLGELLESGYTAIVIDLNGRKKTTKLASN